MHGYICMFFHYAIYLHLLVGAHDMRTAYEIILNTYL